MATYMDEEHDELMPPRRGPATNQSNTNGNTNGLYHPIKGANTMNTRAPTDLHTRLAKDYDDNDVPDDEQAGSDPGSLPGPSLISPTTVVGDANAVSRASITSSTSTGSGSGSGSGIFDNSNDDHEYESYGYVNKKKKMRDRPWKKTAEYDTVGHAADDMDIIGVSNSNSNSSTSRHSNSNTSSRSSSPKARMVSPTNHNDNDDDDDDDDDDDLSYHDKEKEIMDNDNDDDDDDDLSLSSRWSQHPSSPEEVKDAHVRAVGLAAQRAAERDMEKAQERNDELQLQLQMQMPYPEVGSAHSSRNNSNASTPAKSPGSRAADHHRVRMEALKMLELVDHRSSSVGGDGYIVKGAAGSGSGAGPETPMTVGTNKIQQPGSGSSVTSIGSGVGNQLKKLTSLRKLRTPRYERVNLNKDDFECNPNMNMNMNMNMSSPPPPSNHNTPIGKLHNVDLPYPQDFDDENGKKGGKDNKSSSWGSRYSIDRHMLAVNGGLTSAQVLDKLDQDHYDTLNKNTSANNMFKTSPHEQESRWNVKQGMTTDTDRESRMRKMWNSMVMNVKERMEQLYTKVDGGDDDHDGTTNNKNNNNHTTTQGAHRRADHSSPRQGIFTGVAMTNFLDRLSPRSREAHANNDGSKSSSSFNWNQFNLVDHGRNQDLPNVNFTAHDDYVIEQRQKRRKKFVWMILLFIVLVVMMSVTVATTKRGGGGTLPAMYYDVGQEIKFWVMSDIPYNAAEETLLSRELSDLHPRDGDFVVHLGDIHQAQVTHCPFSVYDDAADLLKQSPVPVIVLPGNNDWNECPMPERSLDYWMEKLNRFEDNFPVEDHATVPAVNRQIGRDENFAFVQKGVLFIGLNLVDGKVQDEREWLIRHQTNVQWVEMQLSMYNVDEYRAIVLMGHAGYTAKVGDFFWPVVDDLRSTNKPVLYLHASDGQGMIEYNPIDDYPKFTAVRLEKGSKVTPTHVTVLAGPNPFRLDVSIEEYED